MQKTPSNSIPNLPYPASDKKTKSNDHNHYSDYLTYKPLRYHKGS